MTLHTHAKYPRGQRDVWFYEDERGFDIYVEHRHEHSHELLWRTNFRIPWSQIEGAVRRRAADQGPAEDMIETRLATVEDVHPFGLRCPYCHVEINEGDEIASELTGMVQDTPLFLVMCGVCGPRAHLAQPCPRCGGSGEVVEVIAVHGCGGDEQRCARECPVPEQVIDQCSMCGGAGDVLPPAEQGSASDGT